MKKFHFIAISGMIAFFALAIVPGFIKSNIDMAIAQTDQSVDSKIEIANADFPDHFDLRNCDLDGTGEYKNYITGVKMQDPFGTCWAHGAICAAESSILSMQRKNSWFVGQDGNKHDSIDLSEHQLQWFNYSPLEEGETLTQTGEGAHSIREETARKEGKTNWKSYRMHTGGEAMSAIGSFARGTGPTEEYSYAHPEKNPSLRYRGAKELVQKNERGEDCYSIEDEWALDNSLRFKQDYELEEAKILPNYSVVDKDDNLDLENAKYVSGLIKDQLMQGRALSVSHDYDPYTPDIEGKPVYMNTKTWAQYSYKSGPPGHCVTLVGWDDNYPKENFLSSIPDSDASVPQPPANGAWILKNSHGAMDSVSQGITKSKWGINDSGYYYLSYYDKSLVNLCVYKFNLIDHASHDNKIIHQNDYMAREETFSIVKDTPLSSANVFCANNDENLCELSFMTTHPNENVKYDVYLIDGPTQSIDQGKLLCSKTESYQYKGFHRVHLDQTYKLPAGQYFAIVATEKCGDKYVLGLGGDYNHDGWDKGLCNDRYWCSGVVNPGESFMFDAENGGWKDFYDIKNQWEHSSGDTKYCTYDNFPIKAFAYPAASGGSDAPKVEATAQTGDNSFSYVWVSFVSLVISGSLLTFSWRWAYKFKQ